MSVKEKIFLWVVVGTMFASTFCLTARAQSATPQMVITWQAYGSYIPAKYLDKALPNQESKLAASLEIISNGRPVDLSGQAIYWYLNDTLIGNGIGKQYIVFSPFGTAPAFLVLKAELPNYNGTSLIHQVQIPLVGPKTVIEAPHPTGQSSGNPIMLQGTPYFFYASDPSSLSYVWSVNGRIATTTEDPETLQMNLDPGTPSGISLNVSLVITNQSGTMSSNDSTNITYIKQL